MKFSFCLSSHYCEFMGWTPQAFPPPRNAEGNVLNLSSKRSHLIWQLDVIEVFAHGEPWHVILLMEARTGYIMTMVAVTHTKGAVKLNEFVEQMYQQWCLLSVELYESILGMEQSMRDSYSATMQNGLKLKSGAGRAVVKGWAYDDKKLCERIQSLKPAIERVFLQCNDVQKIPMALEQLTRETNFSHASSKLLYSKMAGQFPAILNMTIDSNFRVLDMMGIPDELRAKLLKEMEVNAKAQFAAHSMNMPEHETVQ